MSVHAFSVKQETRCFPVHRFQTGSERTAAHIPVKCRVASSPWISMLLSLWESEAPLFSLSLIVQRQLRQGNAPLPNKTHRTIKMWGFNPTPSTVSQFSSEKLLTAVADGVFVGVTVSPHLWLITLPSLNFCQHFSLNSSRLKPCWMIGYAAESQHHYTVLLW